MFYEPSKRDPSLPHDPFKAIVAPRPIGWISSVSAKGEVNLAPYSFFNAVASTPNVVMFSSEGMKDTVSNVTETKEFVCNFANWDLREQMNKSSAPFARGVNEFDKTGLQAAPSKLVKPPRVAASPCALECKLLQIIELKDLAGKSLDRFAVFGQVVGVHIDDRYIKDGLLDTAAMKPISRCGYHEYSVMTEAFEMIRPATA